MCLRLVGSFLLVVVIGCSSATGFKRGVVPTGVIAEAEFVKSAKSALPQSPFRFSEDDFFENPYTQFQDWWNDAVTENAFTPQLGTLSVVSKRGGAVSLPVALDAFSPEAIYIHLSSAEFSTKDIDLDKTAELSFYWPQMQRSVIVEVKLSAADVSNSDRFWEALNRSYQLAFYANLRQARYNYSEDLSKALLEIEKDFQNQTPPRPAEWQVLKLDASRFEFAQLENPELSKRIVYRFDARSNFWDLYTAAS